MGRQTSIVDQTFLSMVTGDKIQWELDGTVWNVLKPRSLGSLFSGPNLDIDFASFLQTKAAVLRIVAAWLLIWAVQAPTSISTLASSSASQYQLD